MAVGTAGRERDGGDGWYACRHTAATLLLEQGVDVRIVTELLGHSQGR